jgi:hypothetical protein
MRFALEHLDAAERNQAVALSVILERIAGIVAAQIRPAVDDARRMGRVPHPKWSQKS